MSDTMIPFGTWCDRLASLDDCARWEAVSTASYPSTAMILHFLRTSRSELFNSPTQAQRWLDLARRILDQQEGESGRRRSPEHRWLEARLLQARAACLMIQGRLQAAHELYLAALRIFEALDDAVFAATVKRGLLFTYTQLGLQAEAVVLALEALAVFRRWHLRHDYLSAMNNLGLVVLSRGRLDRAEAIFLRLRRAASPEKHYFPCIMHNLVLVRMERGYLTEAMQDIGEFILLCRAADMRIEEARGHVMLGECLLLSNRPEEAVQTLTEARTVLAAARAGFDTALIDIYIAKGLTQLGRLSAALPLLRISAEYFRREGFVTALNDLLDVWMDALVGTGADARRPAEEAYAVARYFRRRLRAPVAPAPPSAALF